MNERLRVLLIRSVFLFLLSLVLVAGFWYHREFYQIGFTNLLIIGGFVTFLVIWAARLAMSGELPRGRPSGEITCTLEEGDRLRGKYDTGPEFARILIVDARRTFLSDLTEAEARDAGYRTAAELREEGAMRWQWRPSDLVTILDVRALGAGR